MRMCPPNALLIMMMNDDNHNDDAYDIFYCNLLFYRSANGIFGKVCRIASEKVVLYSSLPPSAYLSSCMVLRSVH